MKYFELNKLKEIKLLLKTGQISYDEAKLLAKPHLDVLNTKINVIAKKFGKRPSPVGFTKFMR
jgi:hypothetical protein